MKGRFTPCVVTANDLHLGDCVWLTACDRWTRHHHEAELLLDEAHAQLRLLHALRQSHLVVGATQAEARPGPRGPEPVHFRETFRTRGPSNRPHGKQADLTP
ncbi:MAG: DUF2849 domain-containing protein [Rhodobacterales bacterium]|nr:DUF2849 domain-containing protein [Rhodobacterales bacterium]